jgi:hypothetical protein
MCLPVSYKKKKFFSTSLKSQKKGVGSRSISQRYGSANPDPHQNVTDPQHWKQVSVKDGKMALTKTEEDRRNKCRKEKT